MSNALKAEGAPPVIKTKTVIRSKLGSGIHALGILKQRKSA